MVKRNNHPFNPTIRLRKRVYSDVCEVTIPVDKPVRPAAVPLEHFNRGIARLLPIRLRSNVRIF
jgi:hypothetical protein